MRVVEGFRRYYASIGLLLCGVVYLVLPVSFKVSYVVGIGTITFLMIGLVIEILHVLKNKNIKQFENIATLVASIFVIAVQLLFLQLYLNSLNLVLTVHNLKIVRNLWWMSIIGIVLIIMGVVEIKRKHKLKI